MPNIIITKTGFTLVTPNGNINIDIPNIGDYNIGPDKPNYHFYTPSHIVGSKDPNSKNYISDKNIIWNNLKEEPFPSFLSSNKVLTTNSESDVPFFGPVTHYIDDNNKIVVNATKQDHVLYPGFAIRYLTEENNNYVIYSIGLGNGDFGYINEKASDLLWGWNSDRIKNESILEDRSSRTPTYKGTIDNSRLDFVVGDRLGDISNSWMDGLVFGSSNYSAKVQSSVLNVDGFYNNFLSGIVSDNYRPGNQELVDRSFYQDLNNVICRSPLLDIGLVGLGGFGAISSVVNNACSLNSLQCQR